MRFEFQDLQNVNNTEDARNLVKVCPNAFINLTKYAQRLFNEASLVLAQISSIEHREETTPFELIEAKERFQAQQAQCRRFLNFCKEAKLISEIKTATAKSALKNLVADMYYQDKNT